MEQREYEGIRPLVLFGEPVPGRAAETSASERTPPAKRRMLLPRLHRLIVDLKAEHSTLNLNEIARSCYVRAGRVVLDG